MNERQHLHLVSDATGETIRSMARACLVQFDGVSPIEHLWTLIRTQGQMERVIQGIERSPGLVLFTIVNGELRDQLEAACRRAGVPAIAGLDPVIRGLSAYFGRGFSARPGLQHALDAEYFHRIEAINFALAHDDGQLADRLEDADVVICGVSRTSKSPTCMYLANRGIKAANVPIVPGVPPLPALATAVKPLIVGVTKDPARLIQLRRNRLMAIADDPTNSAYTDPETVRAEVAEARRIFARHGWPVIDVTRRSIEETAAAIITLFAERQVATAPLVADGGGPDPA